MANNTPPEVLENICQHLQAPELKTARLLCRSFDPVARQFLFSEVVIRTNLASLKKLSWISRHAALRHFVKKICYNTRLMNVWYRSLEGWSQRGVAIDGYVGHDRVDDGTPTALGASNLPINPTGQPFLPAESVYHYSQYRYHVDCQKRMLAGNQLTEWISAACASLPNLEAMALISRLGSATAGPSSIGSETLVEPNAEPTDTERFFMLMSLIKAARSSNTRLRSISGRISVYGFMAFSSEKALDDLLRNVRCLMFDVDHVSGMADGHGTVASDYFASFLARASMLHKLHLHCEIPLSAPGMTLDTLLRERAHWPSLRDLKLTGLICGVAALKDFLSTHASTLKQLELIDIRLVGGYLKSIKGAPETSYNFASWVNVIEFLAESLQLRHVRLDGRLVAPRELWITHDEQYFRTQFSDDPSYVHERSTDNLRSKIEEYILHAGKCPLTLPPSGSDLLQGYGDWSWYFSVQRLPCDNT